MRARRLLLGTATLAGAVCLCAVALAATPDRVVLTSDEGTTSPGQLTGNYSPICPEGSFATSLGFSYETTDPSSGHAFIGGLEHRDEAEYWLIYHENHDDGPRDLVLNTVCRSDGKFFEKRKSKSVGSASDAYETVEAKCPKGSSVVGGGGILSGPYDAGQILQSRPVGSRTWLTRALTSEGVTQTLDAIAICDKKNDYETVKAKGKTPTRKARQVGPSVATYVAQPKCPKGATTSGGGFAMGDDGIADSVIVSRPKKKNTWDVRARFFGEPNASLDGYALCRLDG